MCLSFRLYFFQLYHWAAISFIRIGVITANILYVLIIKHVDIFLYMLAQILKSLTSTIPRMQGNSG
jgi:hypothetical protein